MAVASDCVKEHLKSALAFLNGARVATAGRKFELAARMLNAARKLEGDEITMQNIDYQENMLAREHEIAGGSQLAMAQHLLIYACQMCGRLIEYITVPCIHCGWQPTTLTKISHSGLLCTNFFSLWDLLVIGREMAAGRKSADVVPKLAQVVADYMAEPRSEYRRDIENVFKITQRKKSDDFLAWLQMGICQRCGFKSLHQDAKQCHNCNAPLHLPPPLRLLMGATRLIIHFQLNFEAPRSTEFDSFIRYLVSLQSKLCRTQETPSERERAQVLNMMTRLPRFEVVNGLGYIVMTVPRSIAFQLHHNLPEAKKALANRVLTDFRDTVQFFANWMSRAKALS